MCGCDLNTVTIDAKRTLAYVRTYTPDDMRNLPSVWSSLTPMLATYYIGQKPSSKNFFGMIFCVGCFGHF